MSTNLDLGCHTEEMQNAVLSVRLATEKPMTDNPFDFFNEWNFFFLTCFVTISNLLMTCRKITRWVNQKTALSLFYFGKINSTV